MLGQKGLVIINVHQMFHKVKNPFHVKAGDRLVRGFLRENNVSTEKGLFTAYEFTIY